MSLVEPSTEKCIPPSHMINESGAKYGKQAWTYVTFKVLVNRSQVSLWMTMNCRCLWLYDVTPGQNSNPSREMHFSSQLERLRVSRQFKISRRSSAHWASANLQAHMLPLQKRPPLDHLRTQHTLWEEKISTWISNRRRYFHAKVQDFAMALSLVAQNTQMRKFESSITTIFWKAYIELFSEDTPTAWDRLMMVLSR